MNRLLPQIGADIVGFAAHLFLFGWLYQLFAERPTSGGLFLLGLYVLFCFGVNFLRKLQPYPDAKPLAALARLDFRANRTAVVLLTLVAVAFAVAVQVDLNDFVGSMAALGADQFPEVHEGEVSLYFMFGPSFLWLGSSLFYLVVMVTQVEETAVPETTTYAVREFLGLTISNLLMVSYGAYLAGVAARTGNAGLWAVLAVVVFGLMFGVPRLLAYLKNPQLVGWVTFGLLVLSTAVRIIWPFVPF
ncbi:MAG: hypothetical protein KDD89_01740 [Anaerolineales bacterium]|nr:hypothetical protein [Anaerolineales bacterium]